MSYRVEEINRDVVPLLDKAIDSKKYPLDGYEGSITSILFIVQVALELFKDGSSQSEFKNKIIIHQKHALNGNTIRFLLYEGEDLETTKEAFIQLQSALAPLLYQGSVMLSKKLLNEVVLPKPLDDEAVIAHLIEVIESDPKAHSDWLPIINLLNKYEARELTPEEEEEKDRKEEEEHEKATSAEQMQAEAEQQADQVSFFEGFFDFVVDFIGLGDEDDGASDKEISDKIWKAFLKQIKTSSSVSTKEILKVAANAFSVNSGKYANKSSLVIAIEKNYLETAMSLLLAGCNPNAKLQKGGGTAIHVAVTKKKHTIVKLLLAFNADPTILNEEGKSPLDLAEPGSDIYKDISAAVEAHAKSKQYFSAHSTAPLPIDTSKLIYFLSMDGGGVGCFNTAQYLIAIEERMKELNDNCNSLHSYFDYVAGTSAGGIATLILLYTDHDLHSSRYLTYKMITDVLEKDWEDRGKLMNKFFIDIFGKNKVMRDLTGSQRVIVTTALANRDPNKLHLMTNYGEARDGQLGPDKRKLWKAARMTSAAPIYFPAVDGKYLDGGLMANNPTLDSMAEIIGQNHNTEFGIVLSVGTGRCEKARPVKHINTFVPGFTLKTVLQIPNTLKGIRNLFDHFVDQVTRSDGQEVERARAWCKSSEWPYYRLSPFLYGLSEDIALDSTDRELIIDMLFHTQLQILDNPEIIDTVAKKLLEKQ